MNRQASNIVANMPLYSWVAFYGVLVNGYWVIANIPVSVSWLPQTTSGW